MKKNDSSTLRYQKQSLHDRQSCEYRVIVNVVVTPISYSGSLYKAVPFFFL